MAHGNKMDKFSSSALTPVITKKDGYTLVSVKEAIATIEMSLKKVEMINQPDERPSRMFFGNIVNAYIDPNYFDDSCNLLQSVPLNKRPAHNDAVNYFVAKHI